jgi:hypothetical protein
VKSERRLTIIAFYFFCDVFPFHVSFNFDSICNLEKDNFIIHVRGLMKWIVTVFLVIFAFLGLTLIFWGLGKKFVNPKEKKLRISFTTQISPV